MITAYSPQAKGRIERLWQTLQGRLPDIFKNLEIDTIKAANEFLATYIDKLNTRFAISAKDETLHWQEKPKNFDLLADEIIISN